MRSFCIPLKIDKFSIPLRFDRIQKRGSSRLGTNLRINWWS